MAAEPESADADASVTRRPAAECPTDVELACFLEGDAAQAALDQHLASCSSCARRLVGLLAGGSLLSSGTATVAAQPLAFERLLAPGEPSESSQQPARRGGAALAVLVAALFGWVLPSPLLERPNPKAPALPSPGAAAPPPALVEPQLAALGAPPEDAFVAFAEELRAFEAELAGAEQTIPARLERWRGFSSRARGTPYADYAATEIEALEQQLRLAGGQRMRSLTEAIKWVALGRGLDEAEAALRAFPEEFPGVYVEEWEAAQARLERMRGRVGEAEAVLVAWVEDAELRASAGFEVAVHEATLFDPEPAEAGTRGYIKLDQAGQSELRFTFELEEAPARLVLSAALLMARVEHAFAGRVTLELNGEAIVRHWSPGNHSWTPYLWEVTQARRGRNELVLRSEPDTFNQVWVEELRVYVIPARPTASRRP